MAFISACLLFPLTSLLTLLLVKRVGAFAWKNILKSPRTLRARFFITPLFIKGHFVKLPLCASVLYLNKTHILSFRFLVVLQLLILTLRILRFRDWHSKSKLVQLWKRQMALTDSIEIPKHFSQELKKFFINSSQFHEVEFSRVNPTCYFVFLLLAMSKPHANDWFWNVLAFSLSFLFLFKSLNCRVALSIDAFRAPVRENFRIHWSIVGFTLASFLGLYAFALQNDFVLLPVEVLPLKLSLFCISAGSFFLISAEYFYFRQEVFPSQSYLKGDAIVHPIPLQAHMYAREIGFTGEKLPTSSLLRLASLRSSLDRGGSTLAMNTAFHLDFLASVFVFLAT